MELAVAQIGSIYGIDYVQAVSGLVRLGVNA